MWKKHIALHLHVKNSVRLHQAEVWMISFFLFDIVSKKKKTGFLPQKFLGGATHFMEEENDQETINDVARVVGVLGDKNRKPRGPT